MPTAPSLDLNPAHVRTLQHVVRRGSFSRAALDLHLSQPAVSLHVRQLEERVGVALVERVGKRAFATRAGEILLEHAERAFAEIEAARQALEGMRGVVAGRLRLGTGATASIHLLPPLFRRLRSRHPGLELVVVTGNSAEVAAAVASNQLDLALVTLPVSARALAVDPIRLDPLVAIAPPAKEWRRRAPLTASELAQHPLILYERGGAIRHVIDQWFRRERAVPRVAMELGNAEAIKKLVGAGLGLSIASAMAVETEVKAGALAAIALRPPLARRLAVVHAPGQARDARAARGARRARGARWARRDRLSGTTSARWPRPGASHPAMNPEGETRELVNDRGRFRGTESRSSPRATASRSGRREESGDSGR